MSANIYQDTPRATERDIHQTLPRDSAECLPAQQADNPYVELVERFGRPYAENAKGAIQINQLFFVARFAIEHLVSHETNEREFYIYDDHTGVWTPRSADAIKAMLAEDWQRFADEFRLPALIPLRTNALLESLTSLLRGHVETRDAFLKRGRVIHLANGMLHLDDNGAELCEFSPNYYSRNVCPIPWQPEADCPRFKNELLATALEPEDISLLQRWCGSLLLGGNSAQKIMLLIGTAGGGKSTLLEIIEAVVGPANVCQLRTQHLSERFELSRFLRKTMLSGKDVKGDFLQTEGAYVLNSLVGHDLLSAERKSSNAEFQLRGEFGVAVSCNSRLRVKLDGDVDAWQRRLLIIRCEKPKPRERILDFAKTLLNEEASGILRWMVDGAIMHTRECDSIGDYRLTEGQAARVDQLLAESDSIRHFVTDCISPAAGSDLTTSEIVSAYFDYCSNRGWLEFSSRQVEHALPDLMLEQFRSVRSAHLIRDGKRQKGYPKVCLVIPAER
jgi:P4 family phage/plasmid primase-like protien